jgi:hypothetical protein
MSSRTPTERAPRRRFLQNLAAAIAAVFAVFSPKARAHDDDWEEEFGPRRGHDRDRHGRRRGHERDGDGDGRGRGHDKGRGKGHDHTPPPSPPPPPTSPPTTPPPGL